MGGPAATTISRRRAATRERIVAAAWTLAREHGVGAISLRALAAAVGMRAPSLYEYFGSKAEIYDVLFAEGYRELARTSADLTATAQLAEDDAAVRAVLTEGARRFVAFCTADPARYQLLFQRPVPGYEPSPEAYGPSLEAMEHLRTGLVALGIGDPAHVDLFTALLTGIAAQQVSNQPGGDRWTRLVDDAIDMYLSHVRGARP